MRELKDKPAGHKCKVSTLIDETTLSFGRGDLDDYGFWEKPCAECARAWESRHPGEQAWPFAYDSAPRRA